MKKLLLIKNALAWTALFMFTLGQFVYALPAGYQVEVGQATFNQDGNTLNITASDNSIIQYQSFNIALDETVNITLPSIDSFSLNRVMGGEMTEIFGNLFANGNLILVNNVGFHFGSTANVDVGGLIASTHNISNADFLAGNYLFSGVEGAMESSMASILNEGVISTRDGGIAVLIADAIENRGTLEAPIGTVALAAGNQVSIGLSGDGLISLIIDEATAKEILDKDGNAITEQIKNSGSLLGGKVLLNAQGIDEVFEKSINLDGFVSIDSAIVHEDGVVELISSGDMDVSGHINAEGARIEFTSGENLTISDNITLLGDTTLNARENITMKGHVTTDLGGFKLNPDSDNNGSGTFIQDEDKDFTLTFQEVDLSDYSNTFKDGFTGVRYLITTHNLLAPEEYITPTVTTEGEELRAKFSLREGITMESIYEPSKNRTLGEEAIPVKQTVIFDNPTETTYDIKFVTRTYTDTEEVYWDGNSYSLTETPQVFEAYETTASIVDFAEAIGAEGMEGLDHFEELQHTYITGTSLTYETRQGHAARFDWSDVKNLNHEVSVSRANNETTIDLRISELTLEAQDELILDPEFVLSDNTAYNIRFDGAAASDRLTQFGEVHIGDVNGDGFGDLILGSSDASNNGAASGSAWVFFSTLIDDFGTTTGNNQGLSTATNYNIRYDGAAAGENLGVSDTITTGDVNGDGLSDLIIGTDQADHNGNNSGSVYIMFSTLVDDVGTTTGNNLGLDVGTNYNIRYDGSAADDTLADAGAVRVGDVNGDGLSDFVVSAPATDFGGSASGSVYVMFSSLIDDVGATTGNNLDLGVGTNYNTRYDGSVMNERIGTEGTLRLGDVNGDNLSDLVMGSRFAANNGATSGSAWVMFSTLIDDVGATTGNNLSTGVGTTYNIRYDGEAASNALTVGGAVQIGDVNGDNLGDLILGTIVPGTNAGAAYVMFSTLIDDVGATTGNNQPFSTATNYNIRYTGAAINEQLTLNGSMKIGDVNGDGLNDLVLPAPFAANSFALAGSVYIVFSTLVDDVGATTANNLAFSDNSNYNIRYDGDGASAILGFYEKSVHIADIDGDNLSDLIIGSPNASLNGGASGSVYTFLSTLIDDVGATTGNDLPLATATNYTNRYDGEGAASQLGNPESIDAGDINGDGAPDLVVGSQSASNGGNANSGSVWAILGTPPAGGGGGTSSTNEVTIPDRVTQIINVEESAGFFEERDNQTRDTDVQLISCRDSDSNFQDKCV